MNRGASLLLYSLLKRVVEAKSIVIEGCGKVRQ